VGAGACSAGAPSAQGGTDRPGGQGDASGAATASVPEAIRALKPMTDGIVPITGAERQARIERARKLMADNRLDAIMLEGGSSMYYFTGVRWGLSERPFVAVIPAKGELAWICPGFEEARARELVKAPSADVRTWQGDDSP
jgi:Xaa-Pro dipeptidase